MKKVIALLTLMMFVVSLFAMPTVSLAAGTKSDNYNKFTTTGSNYNTSGDVRGNDGNRSTSKNHTNRAAGNVCWAWFDLLTLDSRATDAGTAQRTEVPKYNKIVFYANQWNTGTLTVYHGSKLGVSGNGYDIDNRGWTEARVINSFGKTGNELCTSDMYQSFSFDATTDRYIGYNEDYIVTGQPFYLGETEVYYVTPNSMEVTTDAAVLVNAGDTFTATADVLDVDGDVINDTALNGYTWSIEGTNATIDSKSGLVTIGSGFSANEKITLTATSTWDASISASKTITLVNKEAVEGVNKSENYLLNMPGSSGWGYSKNINDGDYTTATGGGNHSASFWTTKFDMSSHDYVRYNKLVVTYSQYNTEYIIVQTGSDSNVSDGIDETKYVYLDYTVDNSVAENMRQVVSFDSDTSPYLNFTNKYWYATNSGDAYQGKYPFITEIELYYVKPVEIQIAADDVYNVGSGATISPAAKVLDVDGDEILDSALNGITWSVAGSDAVSIDASTGVITVNSDITSDQVITLTATGYEGLSASKEITLTNSTIGSMEIENISDFIMTNKAQAGNAVFYPEAKIYGHNGSEIEADVVWSIEGAPVGVELLNEATGAFSVENTADVSEFTLICTPVSDEESAYAAKTIKINEKVNLALGSIAWGQQTWGGASAYRIFDGDIKTYHSHGGHSGGAGVGLADLGEETDANYMVVRFTNINNTRNFRVAAANELNVSAPTENGKEYAPADLPRLVPYNGHNAHMGTTLWTGRSDDDAAIDSNYEQEHIITEKDTHTYLDTSLDDMRYISFMNTSIGSTADYGVFGITELELYNTAPNYVKINLPEAIDISSSDAEVTLTADVYNGLAAEAKSEAASGTWSSQGFNITEDGVLTVPSTDEYVLGTVTYSYVDENKLEATATTYVCTLNGELKFSDDPTEFIGCKFENGLVEVDGTIYAPADMDISTIYESITSDWAMIDAVMVTDSDLNEITEGEITDGYTVYVISGDVILTYALTTQSSLDVDVTNADGTHTAKCSLKADVENATLIIAEYNGNKLVNVDFDAKDSAADELSASISGVADGNTVKTMLVESITSMKPLK